MKFVNRKKFTELPARRDGSRDTTPILNPRISACRFCGHVRVVDATFGLCSVGACKRKRKQSGVKSWPQRQLPTTVVERAEEEAWAWWEEQEAAGWPAVA